MDNTYVFHQFPRVRFVLQLSRDQSSIFTIVFFLFFLFLFFISDDAIMVDEGIALPRFMAEVKNQTVTAGRAARLTCKVKDLGNYKVR